MGEFASKGVAGAGLGTGIAGLALGVMNAGGNILGNGWGRGFWGNGYGNCGWNGWGTCGNGAVFDMSVNEALASRDAEIARLQAKAYSDESDIALYKYIDGELRSIRQELCDQKVFNATVNGAVGTLSSQLKDLQTLIAGITRIAVPTSAICNFDSCNCPTTST